ncbi:hypothetical protein J437_LFUL011361 [Ladona fulva]|uniref:BED-type domain-containing protein n=1 Tax=Ladona fulva TaxID=123851 RepID=A0A8K0KIF7_LADFU|nr:hypothetical protein J437_LFUL011361 [Ladona fulva]
MPDNRLTHFSVSVLRCVLRLLIAIKPKTSAIWNFFCEIDSNTAKCNICEKIYSRIGGTTTSLKRHLNALHRDKYEELMRLDKEPRLATERDPKTQLEKAKNSKNKKWDACYSKSKEIDKLISEMIALEDLPFIFVRSLGFRRFMQYIFPN